MKIRHSIKRYPFISYTIFCVLFGLFAFFVANLGTYDDRSIGFIGLILVLLWSVVAFPFSICMELFGPSTKGAALGLFAGLLICIFAEFLFKILRTRINI